MRIIFCEHLGSLVRAIPSCGCPRKFLYKCNKGQGHNGECIPEHHCEKCFMYTPNLDHNVSNHLLFHIAPFQSARPCWEWHLTELKNRISLFDGMKFIYIMTGERLEKPEIIQNFLGEGYEYRILTNDERLGETATWVHAWSTIIKNLSGRLFFAHAKGVTRDWERGTIKEWCRLMYETCLDYPDKRNQVLAENPTAGSLVTHGFNFPGTAWFYTGTFFWMNIEQVRDKWAKNLQWSIWGVESWPGRHFPPGLIFYEGAKEMNMYSEDTINQVNVAYKEFSQKHKLERLEWIGQK